MDNSKIYKFKKRRKVYYVSAGTAEDAVKAVNNGFEEKLTENNLSGTANGTVISFGGKE